MGCSQSKETSGQLSGVASISRNNGSTSGKAKGSGERNGLAAAAMHRTNTPRSGGGGGGGGGGNGKKKAGGEWCDESTGSVRSEGGSCSSSDYCPKSVKANSRAGGSRRSGISDSERSGSFGEMMLSGRELNLSHSVSAVGLDAMNDLRHQEGDLLTNCIPFELPFGRPIEEVYEGVHDGVLLGSGISGLVRLCTHRATGHKYAVKCLDLDLVETDEGLNQLREEIYIMCQLDHPNIVRLEEVYEGQTEIYLVQELCLGGELFDRLDEQPDYHYTEQQCARLVKQMLCSVRYLHSRGIVHRDLKLENFLFSSRAENSELKMIDFGLSKHFSYGEQQTDAVGTPYTVAPEVIRGSYDERCDVWAIGVIAYLLLSGEPPFGGCGGPEPLMEVRAKILSGQFEFEPEEIWTNVSEQAKTFIRSLLVTDPSQRPNAEGAQRLPWIKDFSDSENASNDRALNPNVVRALINFKEFNDMKKLLCEVLSFTLMPEQIRDLRQQFEILDVEGTGFITMQALKGVLKNSAVQGSLGALTETEIEDIFNAMRVRHSDGVAASPSIQWHEFIAAGLSQVKVDDRNLKLAFDRMDTDHCGYITLTNIMNLLGRDGAASEERVRQLYFEGMEQFQVNKTGGTNSCDCRISLEDFMRLMKGQNNSTKSVVATGNTSSTQSQTNNLSSTTSSVPKVSSSSSLNNKSTNSLQSLGSTTSSKKTTKYGIENKYGISTGSIAAPTTSSTDLAPSVETLPPMPTPSGLAVEVGIRAAQDDQDPPSLAVPSSSSSPLRSLPTKTQHMFAGSVSSIDAEPASPRPRRRNSELHRQNSEGSTTLVPVAPINTNYHEAVPTGPSIKDVSDLLDDESAHPLQVNRQLYRIHRQMRLGVLEASKRFEEDQERRLLRNHAMAQEQKSKNNNRAAAGGRSSARMVGAGLVMVHGKEQQMSSEEVRKILRQRREELEKTLKKAHRQAGRGRRTKTVSDMTGMLASPTESSSPFSSSPTTPKLNMDKDNLKGSLTLTGRNQTKMTVVPESPTHSLPGRPDENGSKAGTSFVPFMPTVGSLSPNGTLYKGRSLPLDVDTSISRTSSDGNLHEIAEVSDKENEF